LGPNGKVLCAACTIGVRDLPVAISRGAPEELAEDQEHDRGRIRLLGTEIDDSGISWALLARELDGELELAGPAIIRPPSHARAEWAEKFAAMSIDRPVLKGLQRANKARWLKPEIRVRAQHLKAKGTLRHATVKVLIER
jgi:hypothetical protein